MTIVEQLEATKQAIGKLEECLLTLSEIAHTEITGPASPGLKSVYETQRHMACQLRSQLEATYQQAIEKLAY